MDHLGQLIHNHHDGVDASTSHRQLSDEVQSRVVPLQLRQAKCDDLRVKLRCNYTASLARQNITPQMPYVITCPTAPKALFLGGYSYITPYFGFGSFVDVSHVTKMTILCPFWQLGLPVLAVCITMCQIGSPKLPILANIAALCQIWQPKLPSVIYVGWRGVN